MEVKTGEALEQGYLLSVMFSVLWLVLVWSRYGYFLTVSLENHWHKTPVASIPSLVSSCCCNRNYLLFPPWHLITPVREHWLELLFKTLKCRLRCYFHRYIKEQSPSIYLLLDHQLDGWMLIVSLWTLIWLLTCYGELNLLNVCKF